MRNLGRASVLVAAALLLASVLPASKLGGPTAPASAALAGCFADDCRYAREDFPPETGRFIDADTWESTPMNGTWHDFPGQKELVFFPPFGGRDVAYFETLLSVSPNPYQDGNLVTEGAGNVALYRSFYLDRFSVNNGTCSQYYIRVVAHAYPAVASDAGAEGGADPDGGETPDAASSDAGALDGSTPDDASL